MWTRSDVWENVVCWDVPSRVIAGERPAIPEDCPPEFSNMINRCWQQSVPDRPEFVSIADELVTMLDKEKDAIKQEKEAEAAEAAEASQEKKHKHHHKHASMEGGMQSLTVSITDNLEELSTSNRNTHTSSGSRKSTRVAHRPTRTPRDMQQDILQMPESTAESLGFQAASIARRGNTLVSSHAELDVQL